MFKVHVVRSKHFDFRDFPDLNNALLHVHIAISIYNVTKFQ